MAKSQMNKGLNMEKVVLNEWESKPGTIQVVCDTCQTEIGQYSNSTQGQVSANDLARNHVISYGSSNCVRTQVINE